MTDLSNLIKNKNGGSSGRKMRGHLANSQNQKAASKALTNKETVIDKSQKNSKRVAKSVTVSDSSSESECDTSNKFYSIRKLLKKEFTHEIEKNHSPRR